MKIKLIFILIIITLFSFTACNYNNNSTKEEDTHTHEFDNHICKICNYSEQLIFEENENSVCVLGIKTNDKIVSIPSTYKSKPVEVIKENSFKNNQNIESVIIGLNVTKTETSAFENCINLKSVYIPKSVKILENNVFKNSLELKIYFESESLSLESAIYDFNPNNLPMFFGA